MKFLHLSDLHIGKRVNEFSMLDDQKYILEQILKITKENRPDAVLIAGDLYDRSVPPGEAVGLLDDFLTELVGLEIPVFAISGNHDSPERLDFGSRIMRETGLVIAGAFTGRLFQTVLSDKYGPVRVSLLPFLCPNAVAPYFGERADSYENAVCAALETAPLNPGERNVLVAHQFVTAGSAEPERCDSETVTVGGVDRVDVSAFDGFDYVALGHLHGAQRIGRPSVRYAGSPLKYSFSETRQKKSVTFVELGEPGKVEITQIPLCPIHDMREIRGPIANLTAPEVVASGDSQDYIRAVLTDEKEITDAVGSLRAVYPNLMRIDFENSRTAVKESRTSASGDISRKTPFQLFEEFYAGQTGTELSVTERRLLKAAVEAAEGSAE